MDLFFNVWLNLKLDFWLSRWVRIDLYEIVIRIYSGDDLIVIVKMESDQVELAYLMAAKNLIDWAKRNYNHAKSATNNEVSWTDRLKQLLPEEVEE